VTEVLRIANCSGFFGDRLAAAREMVDGGPIDVLTGDWLAELTMLLLARQRMKHGPGSGYARTFLTQMEQVLGSCLDRDIRVVSNAGGLDPEGCAAAVGDLADRLGLSLTVAHVTGDDLVPRLAELAAEPFVNLDTGEEFGSVGMPALTANAYLGGFGIKAALDAGADVVITGRVTDAALVVGPAAHAFGWTDADLDPLAGAVVAGHVIECGAQATGGNYAFFQHIPGLEHPGFPIAELSRDGSSVITKHPGTGGAVTVGTVTAQLLYELGGPAYANPDVTARFDTIELSDAGPDRVRISGVRGARPPERLKVALNYLGGFTNTMTLVLTGLDLEAKSDLALRTLWARTPAEAYDHVDVQLIGVEQVGADSAAGAQAHLRVTVKDRDPEKVGRRFSNAFVEMALSSYPGFFPTTVPGDATPYGVYWPTTVPGDSCPQQVIMRTCTHPSEQDPPADNPAPLVIMRKLMVADDDAVRRNQQLTHDHEEGRGGRGGGMAPVQVALGRLVGARSGDKGGTANVGLWVPEWREPELRRRTYDWLIGWLTADRVRELLPETVGRPVEIHRLPNLFAVNVLLPGFLGRGVAANDLLDPQAKGLGERLRACPADVPADLVPADGEELP
jgi:Acyclic terpene utilisation family protein AtuA